MRHGEAPAAARDQDRMLNNLGKEQCQKMQVVFNNGFPDQVLSSDFRRAVDSAELILPCHEVSKRAESELLRPMADAKLGFNRILELFSSSEEAESALVVCHLPIISELAALAIHGNLKEHFRFPCASVMKLEAEYADLGCFSLLWHKAS